MRGLRQRLPRRRCPRQLLLLLLWVRVLEKTMKKKTRRRWRRREHERKNKSCSRGFSRSYRQLQEVEKEETFCGENSVYVRKVCGYRFLEYLRCMYTGSSKRKTACFMLNGEISAAIDLSPYKGNQERKTGQRKEATSLACGKEHLLPFLRVLSTNPPFQKQRKALTQSVCRERLRER